MAVDRTQKVSAAPQGSAKGVGGLSNAKTADPGLEGCVYRAKESALQD